MLFQPLINNIDSCIPALKSVGSADDKISDSAAKLAKLRPMRVEMYGMIWNGEFGDKIGDGAIGRGVMYYVPTQRPKPVTMNAVHWNGQREDDLLGNNVFRPSFNYK